jgi:hypothetical protein
LCGRRHDGLQLILHFVRRTLQTAKWQTSGGDTACAHPEAPYPRKILMRVLVSTLAVVWLVACSDPLRPSEVVGTYLLASIDGTAPPTVIVDTPDCRITVIGGELELSSDGRFELRLDEVTACPEPTEPGEVAQLWLGQYTIDGRQIILTASASETIDIAAEFRGARLMVEMGGRLGVLGFERAS